MEESGPWDGAQRGLSCMAQGVNEVFEVLSGFSIGVILCQLKLGQHACTHTHTHAGVSQSLIQQQGTGCAPADSEIFCTMIRSNAIWAS